MIWVAANATNLSGLLTEMEPHLATSMSLHCGYMKHSYNKIINCLYFSSSIFAVLILSHPCMSSRNLTPTSLPYHWQWHVACWQGRSRGCEEWAVHGAGVVPGLPAVPGLRWPSGYSAGRPLRTRDWPAASATGLVGSHRHYLQMWP